MYRALIIASDYSANYSVGSQRVSKFQKYLPYYGFDTIILAPSNSRWPSNRSIIKTFSPVKEEKKSLIIDNGSAFDSFLKKIKELIIYYFLIPDVRILWLPKAVLTGLRAISREKIDIILSTSPTNSMHLIAAVLSLISGKPWVADFRDGWIYESINPFLRHDCWRRRVESRLEKWVVSRACAVVAVSKPITDYFRTTYFLNNKYFTITNGYDPSDWENIIPITRKDKRFRFVYTGSFLLSSMTRSHTPILRALQLVNSCIRSKMELLLVGTLTEAERAAIKKCKLSDVIKEIGQVKHAQSLAYQLSADCLLLMVGKDRSVATSKLYEYLYAKRPILAISAIDTAAAEIIRETASGEIVDPENPHDIAACMIRFYENWQRSKLLCLSSGIEQYERKELANKLAKVLLEVVQIFPCHTPMYK